MTGVAHPGGDATDGTTAGPTGIDSPDDDAVVDTVWALRWQARYCRHHNAPVAAAVCDAVADNIEHDGDLTHVMPRQVRMGDWVGLRVMGCVHRLAIDRLAPAVAVCAPTLGGTSPFTARHADEAVAAFSHAVVDALVSHTTQLTGALARVPQTNEPGRARALRVALAMTSLPVRLVELGASAGLNLRADHLPGDPAVEQGPQPQVKDRLGCDLNPVDPTTTEGRTWLSGFVWLDDTDRFAALAHALDVAAAIPATVVRSDACTLVPTVELVDGTTTVVWHSALWPYLTAPQRASLETSLDHLGSTATPQAQLWHVSWEPGPDGPQRFELVVRRWTGGPSSCEVVAAGDPHGRSITLM